MSAQSSDTVCVVGDHVVVVSVDDRDAPASFDVTVHIDGRHLRSFEEPGWRTLRWGVADRAFYWWSARRVVSIPISAPADLELLETDEDLIFAFRRPNLWLLVCETSLRVVVAGVEVQRIEFPDVLVAASIDGHQVILQEASGSASRIELTSNGLNLDV